MANNLLDEAVQTRMNDEVLSSKSLLPTATSDWEQAEQQRTNPPEQSSVNEVVNASFRQDSFISGAYDYYTGSQIKPEQDYSSYGDPAKFLELTKGIPEEWHSEFYKATSPTHAAYIRTRLEEKMADQNILANAGVGGNIARLGVNLVSPDMLATGFLSGGMVTAARALKVGSTMAKANVIIQDARTLADNAKRMEGMAGQATTQALALSRLAEGKAAVEKVAQFEKSGGNVALGLTTGFTTNAGFEKLRQGVNFENDDWMAFDAGLMGLAFSAPFVGIAAKDMDNLWKSAGQERQMIDILKDLHANPNAVLSPESEAFVAQYVGKQEASDTFKGHGSIGAAQALEFRDPNAPSQMLGGRKYILEDLSAFFNKQPNTVLRGLADDLFKDPLNNSATVGQKVTAGELTLRYKRTLGGHFHSEAADAFQDASKEMGWGVWGRFKNQEKWYADVTRVARGDASVHAEYPPAMQAHMEKAAAAQRKSLDDMLEAAKRAGVEGADSVTVNDLYVNRVWRQDKLRAIAGEHGEQGLYDFLSNAARAKGWTNFTPDKAQAFLRTVRQLEYSHVMQDLPLAKRDIEGLRAELNSLRDASGNPAMTPSSVDNFISTVTESGAASGEGKAPNLKMRLIFDENYSEVMPNGKVLRASDMLENDSRLLTDRYINSMAGHTALAEKGWSASKIQAELRLADEEHGQYGLLRSSDEYMKGKQWIEDRLLNLTGKPMSMQTFGGTERGLRAVRSLTRASLLGELGLTAFGELKNAIAISSMHSMTKQMPSLLGFIKSARTGHIANKDLMKDIHSMFGFGLERKMSYARQHELTEFSYDRNLTKFEDMANSASHITDVVSGNAHFTSFTREASAAMEMQKFSDYANGFKELTPQQRLRMTGNGIDEARIDEVMADLKAFSRVDSDEVLQEIDWEQWSMSSPETYGEFQTVVERGVRESIQDMDMGELPAWVHSSGGKIFSELRNFSLGAHSKQMLKGMHYKDSTTFLQWSYAFVGEAMMYTVQQNINYAHDPATLKKKLTLEAIAKAAVNRMGVAGVLPMILETPYQMFTGHALLGSDTANTGNRNFLVPPSMVQVQKAYGAVKTVGNAVSPFNDNPIKKAEVKSALQALPLSNTWGVRNLVDMTASGLGQQ